MNENDPASTHEKVASKMVRSEKGRFVRISDESEGENLVDVKVHNPFKKIYAILESIKKKQETTLAFKATIPLIAIPIILAVLFGLGGFQIGRLNPMCQSHFTTRIGTLYVLSYSKPPEKNLLQTFLPWLTTQPSPVPQVAAILKENEEVYQLQLSFPLSAITYHGQQVAVSGELNNCTQTISISTSTNISQLFQ